MGKYELENINNFIINILESPHLTDAQKVEILLKTARENNRKDKEG
ncbi:MAG: hypothetical protein FWF50_05360 [Defluviitaleaceae bacterium]|nr:hypothetical protein [Defluviitaleaceae bacterium]